MFAPPIFRSLTSVLLGSTLCLLALIPSQASAAVTLSANTSARTATVTKSLLTVKFNSAGKGTELTFNGQELIGSRAGFYISNTATAWSPTSLKVVTNDGTMADIAYISAMGELHYVVRDNVAGIYSYFITGNMGGPVGEFRGVYRVNPNLFPNSFNSRRSGKMPTLAQIEAATVIQDSTYRLADGSVYTKYDWADYVVQDHVHGVYGNNFGLWVIPVSTEAFNGGPLKQELTVHVESNTGDSTVLNMLSASHYSAPAVTLPSGKIFGPWLIYLNNGSTADAIARAVSEEAAWPYAWLVNPVYPLSRTTVQGRLSIADGRSANQVRVTLAQPGGDLYAVGSDYWFSALCDSNGNFTIPDVRPGTYSLYAYATQGDITDQFQRDNVMVSGATANLGTLTWTPPNYATKLWTIGVADRKAGEFKLGNQLRSYALYQQVPANLSYTIGTSTPAANWYYCQTGIGQWTVNFDLARAYTGTAHLTVAIAAAAQAASVDVVVNGTKLGALTFPNDGTIYRSANQSGYYRLALLPFAASLLHAGTNSVVFDMTACKGSPTPGGIAYDVIKLEVDDSSGVSTTLQAEAAALAGGNVIETTNGGFNGTGYVNASTSGGTTTFAGVNGNGGGTKSLAIRYALAGTTSRAGSLVVNGAATPITFAPTGAWTTWQTIRATITLNAGVSNTIQFASNGGDLGNIDEITLP